MKEITLQLQKLVTKKTNSKWKHVKDKDEKEEQNRRLQGLVAKQKELKWRTIEVECYFFYLCDNNTFLM